MDARTQQLDAIWKELEFIGQQWAQSLRVDYPLIPLVQLEPRWRSAMGLSRGANENLRLHALEQSVLGLKYENAQLKRRLEALGGAAPPVPLSVPLTDRESN